MKQRPAREFPPFIPIKLVPMTGFRDQELRVTYLPWSDVTLGLVGWEVIPDRTYRTLPVLVYVIPVLGGASFEIRCHVAEEEPNPETDPLLGTVSIPHEMLGFE
jgi:hypothetical protein